MHHAKLQENIVWVLKHIIYCQKEAVRSTLPYWGVAHTNGDRDASQNPKQDISSKHGNIIQQHVVCTARHKYDLLQSVNESPVCRMAESRKTAKYGLDFAGSVEQD